MKDRNRRTTETDHGKTGRPPIQRRAKVVSFHRDALAIVGTPLPGHPLIGRPDSLHALNPWVRSVFRARKGIEMRSGALRHLDACGMTL